MNTKRILFILFVMLAQVLAACGAPATPEPADPAAIAQNFYKALNDGDIEAVMAFVAEDVKCRGGCYLTGKDRYRLYIQADIDRGWRYEIKDLKVEGDRVTYTVDVYSNAGLFQITLVETLQIKDGLIILIQ